MKWSSKKCRILCLLVACVFAMPLSFGKLTGLFLWTSPLLLLTTLLSRHGLAHLSILGSISLLLIFVRHRWYCRWLCPTGFLCDAVSRWSRFTLLQKCPRMGSVVAVAVLVGAAVGVSLFALLDPISMFHAFFNAFQGIPISRMVVNLAGLALVVGINTMAPKIWCTKLCPLGGLQDLAIWPRERTEKKQNVAFQQGRRLTLGVLSGLGIGLIMTKMTHAKSNKIRPPGALTEEAFSLTCIRCGNCMKACPTDIVHSSLDASYMTDLMTPQVSFTSGYCLPNCTACGSVCPSGAIKRFSRADKKTLVMGIARIKKEG